LGELASAQRDLERAQRVSNGLRDAGFLASVLSERADLLAYSGQWQEAARYAGQSGRLFARMLSPHEHLTAGRRTGLLSLAQGDPRLALPSIERAADLARRGYGDAQCRAEIALLLADARLAGRDPEGALDRASWAVSFFRGSRDPGGLARAHVRRSLAALSARNLELAFREARVASSIPSAGPVARGLADLALGRVLLRTDPPTALPSLTRASQNPGLYSPLRSVARLGVALSRGASPSSDEIQAQLRTIEGFGDRRILALVTGDLKEGWGFEWQGNRKEAGSFAVASPSETPDDADARPEFLPGLVGASPLVRQLGDEVRKMARTNLPVLIFGETGTGKERVARAVHDYSPRTAGSFVPFNSASLSDELFESQLFGHVRGSFTGAHSDRPGLVEEARGGTLFIDEIADLSLRAQAGLLRFLELGTYRRVGENRERRADVRIVAAANQNLEDLVEKGRFRRDLIERIRGGQVLVPPLRARESDIVRLARHFVAEASQGNKRLSPVSETPLRDYGWPGNVRELAMEMRRAVALADADAHVIEWRRPQATSARVPPTPVPGAEAGAAGGLQEALRTYERALLRSASKGAVGRAEAARRLGISRQALHQKITRYGL